MQGGGVRVGSSWTLHHRKNTFKKPSLIRVTYICKRTPSKKFLRVCIHFWLHKVMWVKVFKNGSSKIFGRQPLKNVQWYGLLKAVFHKFYLIHSWIPWPMWMAVAEQDNSRIDKYRNFSFFAFSLILVSSCKQFVFMFLCRPSAAR